MKPRRNFSFGKLKNSDPSCYIYHKEIDISTDCLTTKHILGTNDVKLSDLSQLQIETEKNMSIIGYRMLNLNSLIDGKPMQTEKAFANHLPKSSQYLQFTNLPKHQISTLVESKISQINEGLIVKSDPTKPLTLIIAQNRPSKRKSNQYLTNKRKLVDDISETEPKSKKLSADEKNARNVKPNYEIPNKFWELLEPYCTEINEDHIKTLEHYVCSYENDAKYYELPDVTNNNDDSFSENKTIHAETHMSHLLHVTADNNLNGFTDDKCSMVLSNLLKKIDNEIRKPLSQTKTLKSFPQNFVTKMCEDTDQFLATQRSQIADLKNDISTEATSWVSKSLAKQLSVSNTYKIENHIKKSLDDLGMYNFNLPFIQKLEPQFDLCKSSELNGIAKSIEADTLDSVILNDNQFSQRNSRKIDTDSLLGLKRRQAELKLVSESNLGMLRRLLVCAKRDMKRHEIERRLAVADADVIESYTVIDSYRPNHRPPLKKDRDVAYKAIKERQRIIKELESFDSELY